jgi:hypothetical protein
LGFISIFQYTAKFQNRNTNLYEELRDYTNKRQIILDYANRNIAQNPAHYRITECRTKSHIPAHIGIRKYTRKSQNMRHMQKDAQRRKWTYNHALVRVTRDGTPEHRGRQPCATQCSRHVATRNVMKPIQLPLEAINHHATRGSSCS